VFAVLIIAGAIMGSVLIYGGPTQHSSPTAWHVRHRNADPDWQYHLYGRVWPVADNANALARWATTRRRWVGEVQRGRQILADLDAVATRPRHHQGYRHRLGRDCAVSLFNSYIVSVGSGGKGETRASVPRFTVWSPPCSRFPIRSCSSVCCSAVPCRSCSAP